jgi:quercetin dioxygenase-like cupin family protein
MKKHRIPAIIVMTILASYCFAQTSQESKKTDHAQHESHSGHSLVKPEDIKWGSEGALPGTEFAVISGDPSKSGQFVIRIKMRAGLKVPPHWHPMDEHITVLTGRAVLGTGEKYDLAAGKEMTVGSYGRLPKKMPHFLFSKEETIVQVHGEGPFQVNWVNPADDPRKK